MSEMRGAYGGGGDDVGVPCAVGDLDVVETILLLALLAKDMAARSSAAARIATDTVSACVPILGCAHKSRHGVTGTAS